MHPDQAGHGAYRGHAAMAHAHVRAEHAGVAAVGRAHADVAHAHFDVGEGARGAHARLAEAGHGRARDAAGACDGDRAAMVRGDEGRVEEGVRREVAAERDAAEVVLEGDGRGRRVENGRALSQAGHAEVVGLVALLLLLLRRAVAGAGLHAHVAVVAQCYIEGLRTSPCVQNIERLRCCQSL